MQANSNALINEMIVLTEQATKAVKQFKTLDPEQLNRKNSPDEWSILECIEHLNLYGDYYLPEIEKQIIAHKNGPAPELFKSGLLGNYFAELMKEKNGKIKKMKSPADKNPAGTSLPVTTLDRFIKQQELLVSLLVQARSVNLVRARVPVSIARFIRLRLGDTFRFFVYHIERHIRQAGSMLR